MGTISLLDSTFDMLKKAESKGFVFTNGITPVMFEPWMNAEEAFCNTACSIVSMWLRGEGLFIAVAPWKNEFSYFVDGPANKSGAKPNSFGGCSSWEDAWLKGINEALKLLPDVI